MPNYIQKLVLLRHGQSIWNLENRFTGWTDVDLTKKGRIEARDAGLLLKENQFKFDLVLTSYLKRAINTSKLCLKELISDNTIVQSSWRLNERHYGDLQGLNKSKTAKKYGDEQVQVWRRSYNTPPPQMNKNDDRHPSKDQLYSKVNPKLLPDSESLEDTVKRVMPVIKDLLIPEITNNKKIMIVGHGNSLRAILKVFKEISDEEIVSLNIPTGAPYVLEIDANLKVVKDYYLGNIKELEKKAKEVEDQGKSSN